MKALSLSWQNSALVQQQKWIFVAICAVIVLLGMFLSYTGLVLFPSKLSTNTVILLFAMIGATPLVWRFLYKQNRLCLLLATFILLTGDRKPMLTAPLAVYLTLPNLIYLMVICRHSRIKYFLIPMFSLAIIYFFSAFLLGFVDKTIEATSSVFVNLGFFGAFGGAFIVYHMIYFPLAIYHAACHDRVFLNYYGLALSLLVNYVAIVGCFQFLDYLSAQGKVDGFIRITSIMRRSTRLAPFLVISLPFYISGLVSAKNMQIRTYYWVSLFFTVFALLLTASRGPMVAAFILWMLLFLAILKCKAPKAMIYFGLSSLVMGVMLQVIAQQTGLDYFARFQQEDLQAGYDKREEFWSIYLTAIQYEQTSWIRQVLNTLFGYGWFSERVYVKDPHNTFISAFACFGVVGLTLYYLPYLRMLWISVIEFWKQSDLSTCVNYAMVAGLIILFVLTGTVHNKIYSPIESAYTWVLVGLLLKDEFPRLFSAARSAADTVKNKSAKKQWLVLKR